MTIEKFKKIEHIEIYQLWNKEYQKIYPISKELFERNVEYINDDCSFVAVQDDKIVGFILGKTWNDEFHINNYEDCGWVSLIYVIPPYRNQGIGSALLNLALDEFNKLGKIKVNLGTDYYNFFPGLPVDLKSSLDWFLKRGFEKTYNTFDLIRKKSKDFLPLVNKDFEFRIGNSNDKDNIIAFVKANWPGRWTKETMDYFKNGGTGKEYVVCLDHGIIIAFAKIGYPDTPTKLISYSLTWRARFDALGGIGPLGVNASYRHRYLGYDIVAFATNTLQEKGADQIIIDWTGLLDFYRHLDYEVWKSYTYVSKQMKGEKNA